MSNRNLESAAVILSMANPILGAVVAFMEASNLFAQAQAEGRDLTDDEMKMIGDRRQAAVDRMNSIP